MSAPADQRAELIFYEALERRLEERELFLGEVCGGDRDLRASVEELLRAHEAAGAFLSPTSSGPPGVDTELARLKPEETGERIGHYKLLEQIGEGGFGTVWVAEQEKPVRRRVALKIIKLGMDTKEVIARFEQERQALAMMDHPNIAKVLDAGATPFGRPFFVMELVRGIKITEYCDQANLPTEERLQLFIAVCQSIQHAHQKGIIHRDLKPSNILVTLHDGVPVPKVIDFGVAKATQQQRLTDLTIYTQFEQMIGTPLYMSPEQAEMSGLDIDTRSDIYTLGVLLYELLTGRTPFDGEELMKCGRDEIRRIIREQEPPRPSTAVSTMALEARTDVAAHRHSDSVKLIGLLRGDLDWIVMKALEKDRTRRYETANGLAMDIRRFLADEPVSAAAPSASYRFVKFARRNKAPLAAGITVAAILVVATLVSALQAIRASRAQALSDKRLIEVAAERDAKEKARQEAEAFYTVLRDMSRPDAVHTDPDEFSREALSGAVKRLEGDVASQPARRAKLQEILAGKYYSEARIEEAIACQEVAHDSYLAAFGPTHRETLDAAGTLAFLYQRGGRAQEALQMWNAALHSREEALATCRRTHGLEHSATRSVSEELAVAYARANRMDEAIKLREELLATCRTTRGTGHPDTLGAMEILATYRWLGARQGEALKLQEELLNLCRNVRGPEHSQTLAAMETLSNRYDDANRHDEALKLAEELLIISRKTLGSGHPKTAGNATRLRNLYQSARRWEALVRLSEEELALSRERHGWSSSKNALDIHVLAADYDVVGRHGESLSLWEELLTICRKTLGAEHSQSLDAMGSLARAYERAKRNDDAIALWEDILAIRRKTLGVENAITLNAMRSLASGYERAENKDEALKLREEMLPLYKKLHGPEHSDTLKAIKALGDSYSAAGRWDESLCLLTEVSARTPDDTLLALKIASLQAWFGKDVDHSATCRRMIEIAGNTNDDTTAERAAKAYCLRPSSDPLLLQTALTLAGRAVARGKDHQYFLFFQIALGMAEYRHGNYAASDTALRPVVQSGNLHQLIKGLAQFYHAMSLFRQGKSAEARKQFLEVSAQMKPLPTDERQPLANGAGHDDVIFWLAYKEAKALLEPEAPAAHTARQ